MSHIDLQQAAVRIQRKLISAAQDTARTVTLERRRFGATHFITEEFWRSARFDAEADLARRLIRVSVSGLLPALGGDQFLVPATWWDHYKRDMPPRLKRIFEWLFRRPLRIETVTYEVTRYVAGLPDVGRDFQFLDLFVQKEP